MSNIIVKLVIFSIMLNLATGIVISAIPAYQRLENRGGIGFNETGEFNNYVNSFNQTIKGKANTADYDESSNWFLDIVTFGWAKKIIKFLDTYMFGFYNLLHDVFGSYLDVGVNNLIFGNLGVFKIITFVGYVLTAFFIFTNRDVTR